MPTYAEMDNVRLAALKEELEREFKRNLINVPENELEDFVLNLAKRQHINTLEDFYAAIGYGGVLLSRLMPRVKEEFQKTYRSAAEEEKKAALLPQQTAAAGKKRGRTGQLSGQICKMLQPAAGRPDCRIYHPRVRRVHPQAGLCERAELPCGE